MMMITLTSYQKIDIERAKEAQGSDPVEYLVIEVKDKDVANSLRVLFSGQRNLKIHDPLSQEQIDLLAKYAR
jgi:hypothetical protein